MTIAERARKQSEHEVAAKDREVHTKEKVCFIT